VPGVRLEWDGKSAEVLRLRLPLQVVETVSASRADHGTLSYDRDADDGWRNKLIWGDNLHVLASLAEELAGQVDLIYIDPPFDSHQDYEVQIGVGEQYYEDDYVKLQSVIEEKAYRDTWGKGRSSYLQMLYERLSIVRELLSMRGSLVVHVDWHQSYTLDAYGTRINKRSLMPKTQRLAKYSIKRLTSGRWTMSGDCQCCSLQTRRRTSGCRLRSPFRWRVG
jgi:DNA methylase